MSERSDYQAFRARLDAVLREKDAARLREFLVAEGQWAAESKTDTEAALWMMIATSPALADQHQEAKEWLLTHGHEAEARAIFGERRAGKSTAGRQQGNQHQQHQQHHKRPGQPKPTQQAKSQPQTKPQRRSPEA